MSLELVRHLVVPLVGALALMQLALWVLARWIRVPLKPLVVVLAVATTLLLVGPWLRTDRVLAPTDLLSPMLPGVEQPLATPHDPLNDAVLQLLPWELEVRHALGARRLPFWSDLVDGGTDLWANPQAQVVSPIAMLGRLAPLQHHFLVCLALKLLTAFQGAWILCRRLGVGSTAALLGAGSFALGGGIIAWALFPISAAAAWAPWLAAGLVAMARRLEARSLAFTAVVTTILLLSGHPESALAAVCLGVVCGLAARRRKQVSFWRYCAWGAVAGILGAALALPHLLPFVAVASRSLRAGERVVAHAPQNRAATAPSPEEDRPPGWRGWFVGHGYNIWKGPFAANVFGRPYGGDFRGPWAWALACSSYTGMVALAGAAAALARRRLRPVVLALFAFWIASLVLASRFIPLERLLFAVPPLRIPELSRFLPMGALALCVLGALGWSSLRSSGVAKRAAAIAAVLAGLLLSPVLPTLAVSGLVATAAVAAPRFWRLAAVVAALGLGVDLLPWARAQLPSGRADLFFPPTAAMNMIAAESKGGRAVGEAYLVYPGLLSVYGVSDPRPLNPLAPLDQLRALESAFDFAPNSDRYFSTFTNVEHPLLDFLAVRAVVSNKFQPPKRRLRPQPLPGSVHFTLAPNPGALPLWFVPDRAEVLPPAGVHDRLRDLRHARTVILRRDEVGAWEPSTPAAHRADARVVAARPGKVTVAVGGAGDRLLASSVPFFLGWRIVTEGGERLPTLRVNGGYLGARVPANASIVEIAYLPRGLMVGSVLAALSLAILAACVALSGSSRRARPRP